MYIKNDYGTEEEARGPVRAVRAIGKRKYDLQLPNYVSIPVPFKYFNELFIYGKPLSLKLAKQVY